MSPELCWRFWFLRFLRAAGISSVSVALYTPLAGSRVLLRTSRAPGGLPPSMLVNKLAVGAEDAMAFGIGGGSRLGSQGSHGH